MSSQQFYLFEDVKKNNGQGGAPVWIIIKNSVYDVTEFLDKHPGGADLVLEWGGKDATKAFKETGHSNEANQMLKEYKIGELAVVKDSSSTADGPVLQSPTNNMKSEKEFIKGKRRIKFFFCM